MASNFPPLSAKAIATEVSAGRLGASQALTLGNAAVAEREERLQVFTSRHEPLATNEGPLAGVAIGVKDIFDTYDMPTAYGSEIYAHHQPASDASLVVMLRNAGATLAGKTVTTEFAWFSPGPTRNPHNEMHTPGGSSSGSAAGVAAGYFPAAIGSQTGGSIIRPAAFCGVAGYKPSFRLFPTIGMKQFSWSLDTVGFFAASVSDAAFVAGHCSGRDLFIDPTTASPPTIGIYQGDFDHLMDPEMEAALKKAVEMAKDAGAKLIPIQGPQDVEAARHAHAPIQGYEAGLSLADEFVCHADLLSQPLRDYLTDCKSITPDDYDTARRTANRARKASRALFDQCDVLLMPSAPGPAPETLESTGDSRFNQLWTLLGMPCVNVAGMSAGNGLPLGLQIVAPFGKDKKALQAAHWLETVINAKR